MSAIWFAYSSAKAIGSIGGWSILFICVALLYNPIFHVHLNRGLWSALNLATIAAYAIHWRARARARKD